MKLISKEDQIRRFNLNLNVNFLTIKTMVHNIMNFIYPKAKLI